MLEFVGGDQASSINIHLLKLLSEEGDTLTIGHLDQHVKGGLLQLRGSLEVLQSHKDLGVNSTNLVLLIVILEPVMVEGIACRRSLLWINCQEFVDEVLAAI